MIRNPTRFVFPILIISVLLLVAGCSRPQRTEEEVAGPISPPTLRYGAEPPGGISESQTGQDAGGSGAAGMQYQSGRTGGPLPLPVVTAPDGSRIVPDGGNRTSPTTFGADANNSSSGSSGADTGHPIPPNVPLVPDNAPGADTVPSSRQSQGLGQ